MEAKILEMAGGLIQLAIAALVLWVVLEVGCSIFFWVKEREGKR